LVCILVVIVIYSVCVFFIVVVVVKTVPVIGFQLVCNRFPRFIGEQHRFRCFWTRSACPQNHRQLAAAGISAAGDSITLLMHLMVTSTV
jgi:hypothetical protein